METLTPTLSPLHQQPWLQIVCSEEVIIVFSNSWSWPGFFCSFWQLDQVQCRRLEINYAVVKPLIWSKILGCSNVSYITFALCNGQEDLTVSRDLEALSVVTTPLPHFHWGHHTSQPQHRSWSKAGTQHRYSVSEGQEKKLRVWGKGSWESFPHLLYKM